MSEEQLTEEKIKQIDSIDYVSVLKMNQIAPTDINRRVFTDTYVSTDQDAVLNELDKLLEILKETDRGVIGFLSFWYGMITLHYVLTEYALMEKDIDRVLEATDEIDKIIFTGNFENTGFTNMIFGGDTQQENITLKSAKDSYNTANLIHQKASSFESSYSLIVASLAYHYAIDSKKDMMNDINNLRTVLHEMKEEVHRLNDNENEEKVRNDISFETL